MKLRLARNFLVPLLLLLAVRPAAAAPADPAAPMLEQQLAALAAENAPFHAALQRFYAGRDFQPLWTGQDGAGGRVAVLVSILEAAAEHGLEPGDYDPAHLRRLAASGQPEARATLEIDASLALLRYVRDVRIGRVDPRYLEADPPPNDRAVDPLVILEAAATRNDLAAWLAELAEHGPRYNRLRELLAHLRGVAARGGWTRVPEQPALRAGTSHRHVAILRRRLVESGDLAAEAATGEVFDDTLEAAVRRFQLRHGLVPDGVVGRRTFTALNLPVEARIRQVILNLERRRWLPTDLGARYVFVNIADFELKLVVRGDRPSDEHTLFTTAVVVGTPYHQTPIFSRPMTYLVLNPYWNVPRSIATRELLPKFRENPELLTREGYELLPASGEDGPIDPATIDWSRLSRDHFPFRLRQKPGPNNALGRIKFMLPNRYNVYLHDTPARELFDRWPRSFSHGCIRVRDPFALAGLLLAPQGLDRQQLEAWALAGERRVIRLAEPVPVHITYFTAWVDSDGTAHFRDDIYGRDAKLAAALATRRRHD